VRTVKISAIIPLVLSVAALVGFYIWYRNKIATLKPDTNARPLPGARLTAERLRELSSPPWRVVYEIGAGHLGNVDHVVIGPTGVIAIETIMIDRPTEFGSDISDAQRIATAAIERGDVDDLTRQVGVPCSVLAKVYWGTPQPDQPPGVQVATGQIAVEGQRLADWLVALPPGPLATAQVDHVWQTLLTGIGRPDPLA
jgi:hypothetical protein